MRLDDVAARAGVSTATVSRVVNGRPGVSPTTRMKVRAVIEELGYRPTGLDQLPRRSGSRRVGVLVPDLLNPVFPAFAAAIAEQLNQQGRQALVCSTNSSGLREVELADLLDDCGAEGLVFVSSDMTDTRSTHSHYARFHEQRMPMVFVNGRVTGLPVPYVMTDERTAAKLAVDHLLSLGHRRLAAIVGPLYAQPAIDKRAGFLAATARAGLRDCPVESADWGVEGGRAAMDALLRRPVPPTGVVCASDLMAIGAVEAVREAGFEVPRDVSVVGFDDTGLAAHTGPPLTTIRQSIDRMAETAVNLLLGQIADPAQRSQPLHYVFRPELVVRASTARPSQERN